MKDSNTVNSRTTVGPVLRPSLCGLALPCLSVSQRTHRFFFREATVLLVTSGRLEIEYDANTDISDAGESLVLVDSKTHADLLKTPGGKLNQFRSIFLTFDAALIGEFDRNHPITSSATNTLSLRKLQVDDDLRHTLLNIVESIRSDSVSDNRLRYKLLEFLLLLSERGHRFSTADINSVSHRLRTMISEAPAYAWTADAASRTLAMSAATLRRRLAREKTQFEELLIDTRMHHALMLVQTTNWNIAYIAEVSGYKSRVRFSERFQQRFGYPPSAVR